MHLKVLVRIAGLVALLNSLVVPEAARSQQFWASGWDSPGNIVTFNDDGTSAKTEFAFGRMNFLAIDEVNGYLYFADLDGLVPHELGRSNLDGSGRTVLRTLGEAPRGVAVDRNNDRLYYSLAGGIWYTSLDGTASPVQVAPAGVPYGMSYDPVTDQIFWINSQIVGGYTSTQGSILKQPASAAPMTQISVVVENLTSAVAKVAVAGEWLVFTNGTSLRKVKMDGTQLTTLYTVAGAYFYGLAIPDGGTAIYWLNANGNQVYKGDLAGSGSVVLQQLPVSLSYSGFDIVTPIPTGPDPIAQFALTGSGTIAISGNDLLLLDEDGNVIGQADLTVVASLELTGTTGDDSVTLDWGVVEALGSVSIVLGNGFDTLILTQGSGTQSELIFNHVTATDGFIDDEHGNRLTFAGLDPIIDHTFAATKTFNFTGGAETIVLSADGDGAVGNGYSFIDSELAESVSFRNPTVSLVIDAETGADTITLGVLDTPLASTFTGVSVHGYDSTGASDDGSADQFTVTPAGYPIFADGGNPAGTCPGDALALSGSAVVSAFTNTAGSGSFSFSSGEADVSFAGMESVGEASVSIAANYTTLYATDELVASNALEITVTNAGPEDTACLTVAFSEALSAWLTSASASDEGGPVLGTTWNVASLDAGESSTLTITGFVIPINPHTTRFTLSAFQDTDESDNEVELQLSHGFLMPAKTHVNAAAYYTRTAGGGTHDALVVGLYLGSPGIEGSVWCKVPDSAPNWPPPGVPSASIGNQFRPCSEGLPFPLHVNEVFEDASGTLWIATWGSKGLYKSEDDGRSWEASGPFATTGIVYDITQDASGTILYASADAGLVLRSMDGGANWQQLGSLPGVSAGTAWALATHPSLNGVVYAGTPGSGVFYTDDFGFTWAELEEAGTENDVLLAGEAGHVFDLAFSTDADYLFAGTASGVWRANLTAGAADFTGTWTPLGPAVTLDDASTVVPEVRDVTFVDDGADDDLVVGTWGFGAYVWDVPNTTSTHAALALRGSQITFVAAGPDGQVFLGSSTGTTTLVSSTATSTASEPKTEELPEGWALGQNYPNPFNPVTTIGFEVPETARVRLAVYDGLGREVAVLVDGMIEAGRHEARFDARHLPSGTYLYRLQTGQGDIARTLVLMK